MNVLYLFTDDLKETNDVPSLHQQLVLLNSWDQSHLLNLFTLVHVRDTKLNYFISAWKLNAIVKGAKCVTRRVCLWSSSHAHLHTVKTSLWHPKLSPKIDVKLSREREHIFIYIPFIAKHSTTKEKNNKRQSTKPIFNHQNQNKCLFTFFIFQNNDKQ